MESDVRRWLAERHRSTVLTRLFARHQEPQDLELEPFSDPRGACDLRLDWVSGSSPLLPRSLPGGGRRALFALHRDRPLCVSANRDALPLLAAAMHPTADVAVALQILDEAWCLDAPEIGRLLSEERLHAEYELQLTAARSLSLVHEDTRDTRSDGAWTIRGVFVSAMRFGRGWIVDRRFAYRPTSAGGYRETHQLDVEERVLAARVRP